MPHMLTGQRESREGRHTTSRKISELIPSRAILSSRGVAIVFCPNVPRLAHHHA